MKKFNYVYAFASLAFVACTSDEFIGEYGSDANLSLSDAIVFASTNGRMTRAKTEGKDAADLLGGSFVVEGTKGEASAKKIAETVVFNNYNVKYEAGTANTTESNTANWEYVGVDVNPNNTDASKQSIKYWDYSAEQYNFIAYATGKGVNGSNVVSAITPATATVKDKGAYIIEGSATDLAGVYMSDLKTVKKADDEYKKTVTLTFRNANAKVRLGLYETVPGYYVGNVKFYSSESGTSADNAVLYSSTASIPGEGKYVVYFDVNAGGEIIPTPLTKCLSTKGNVTTVKLGAPLKSGNVKRYYKDVVVYNKVEEELEDVRGYYVKDGENYAIVEGDSKISPEEGKDYYKKGTEKVVDEYKLIGETSSTATFAKGDGDNAPDYVSVLPVADSKALTLRVDYTLLSEDGSKEAIHVTNAKAVVPAQYTAWQSNYAYTYLFKISNNTNGTTGTPGKDEEGLYPITFDAVVESQISGTQSTITTVATPSVTTYQDGAEYGSDNEYKVGKPIVVRVQNDENVLDAANGYIYLVSATGAENATEATVSDVFSNLKSGAYGADAIEGNNGIKLTGKKSVTTYVPEHYDEVTDLAKDASVKDYYTKEGEDTYTKCEEDAKAVEGIKYYTKVEKSKISGLGSFTASTAGTYAYIYKYDETYDEGTKLDENTLLDGYYTKGGDTYTACAADAKADGTTKYYKKVADLYAIKVIIVK